MLLFEGFETDCRLCKGTGWDLFFSCTLCFFPQSFSSSHFFLCFIVLFQSCGCRFPCRAMRKCLGIGETLVHEFPIFYSHTEWNVLSSGTNTLLWLRTCYKTTKLHTILFGMSRRVKRHSELPGWKSGESNTANFS